MLTCVKKFHFQNDLSVVADKMQQARDRRKHFEQKLREHLDRVTNLKVKQEEKEAKLQVFMLIRFRLFYVLLSV